MRLGMGVPQAQWGGSASHAAAQTPGRLLAAHAVHCAPSKPTLLAAAAGKADEPVPSSSGSASPEAQAALSAITSTSGSSVSSSSSSSSTGGSKVDQGVAELARSMLLQDSDTAAQLKRYEEALAQLEANKAAAAELDRIFADAERDLALSEAQEDAGNKAKAERLMAEAEVAAAEKMLLAAEMEMAIALGSQSAASKDLERKESVKAGLAAGGAGFVFSMPLLLSAQAGMSGGLVSALLGLAATSASCFLFGVVYRYVVRCDEGNSHLKGGVVGGFGLVRAGAAADVLQATSSKGPFDIDAVVGPAALYAGESMLVFLFASAVVEKVFEMGLVQRYGQASVTSAAGQRQ